MPIIRTKILIKFVYNSQTSSQCSSDNDIVVYRVIRGKHRAQPVIVTYILRSYSLFKLDDIERYLAIQVQHGVPVDRRGDVFTRLPD